VNVGVLELVGVWVGDCVLVGEHVLEGDCDLVLVEVRVYVLVVVEEQLIVGD
jgi:hypothetical protein